MLCSSTCLLSLSILLAYWGVPGYTSPALPTPTRASWSPSLTALSKPSSARYKIPNSNSSRIASGTGTAYIPSQMDLNALSAISASSASMATYDPGKHENVCLVGYCASPNPTGATKTVDDNIVGGYDGATTRTGPDASFYMLKDSDLYADCVLYDSSCSGNKTAARDHFFSKLLPDLQTNPCFKNGNSSDDCKKIETPKRLEEMAEIKDWMRSPQCSSANVAYDSANGILKGGPMGTENCCGTCLLTAGIVDIFYWPEPDADTSCLDIVGTDVNPLTYGATTDSANGFNYWSSNGVLSSSALTYWGCTTKTGAELSFLTTALVTQINDVTFKESLVNPWSPVSCVGSTSPSPSPNLAPRASIHARGHSLMIRNATTQNGGSSVTTMVLSGFTFTSPSVYANFHTISGADECGDQIIPSTMLSFAPGELSTIQGPLDCFTCSELATKPFNARDFPCPPQSIAEANWYKPAHGEPYRPLIAMPDQIAKMNPFFGRCTNAFFTGYDPPRTLEPASAMVPDVTTNDPKVQTSAPMPSYTQDPGARKTTNAEAATSVPAPASSPALADPKQTNNPGPNVNLKQVPSDPKQSVPDPKPTEPDSNQKIPNPGPQSDGPTLSNTWRAQPESSPQNTAASPDQSGGAHTDPGPAIDAFKTSSDPQQTSSPDTGTGNGQDPNTPNRPQESSNVLPLSDPSHVSPDQMSQIENALVTSVRGPQAAATSIQGYAPFLNQQAPSSGVGPSSQDSSGSPQSEVNQQSPNNGIGQLNTAWTGDGNPNPAPPIVSDTPKYQPTVINGEPAVPLSNGVSIAGATLTPGAVPITLAGVPISVGSSNIIVGASAVPLASAFPQQPIPFNAPTYQPTVINGETAQPLALGISIAGTTLTPGAAPVTISGTPIAIGSSNLFIGSSTVPLAAAFPQQTIAPNTPTYQPTMINGETAQPLANGVSIVGATLTPGASAVTISGTPVSVDSSNIIIGTSTVALASAFPPAQINLPAPGQAITAQPQPTTINGQAAYLLPNSNGISIGGTTLTPGAAPLTISGTPVAVDSSNLVIGTNTVQLSSAFPLPLQPQPTTINGQPAILLPSNNGISIAGTTLTPGAAPMTVSGTPIAVDSSSHLIIGSSTIPLTSAFPSPETPLIATLAGQVITAAPSAVEIAGATLTPGGKGVSVSGTLVSMDSNGDVILGTETLAFSTSESAGGLGGLIMRPFAAPTTTTSSSTGSANSAGTASSLSSATAAASETATPAAIPSDKPAEGMGVRIKGGAALQGFAVLICGMVFLVQL